MSDWRPLSRRSAVNEPESLFEDVPPHLLDHVREWVRKAMGLHLPSIALKLRIPLDIRKVDGGCYEFLRSVENDSSLLLDVVDALLWFRDGEAWAYEASQDLETLLSLGGSAWRVSSDGSALERRIDESVSQRAKELKQESSSAAEHLRSAWSACYGRNPDPSKSYSEAIKAVEAAAIPIVLPNDTTATLGKVIGTVKNNPEQFQTAIDNGVESVVGLMGLL